jgi:hypothetical protein
MGLLTGQCFHSHFRIFNTLLDPCWIALYI